ncbi:TolB family protein, partial [Streptomyces sp. NPDC059627]
MSRLSRPFRHGPIARPAVLLVLAFLVASLAVLNRGGPAIASSPAAQGRIAYGGTQIRSIGVIGPADTTTSTPLFPDGPQHYDDEPSARGDTVVWTSLRASAQPQVFIRQGDGAPVQITKGLTGVQYPVLSPDRHRIAFAASTGRTDGGHDLWVVNADGTGLRRVTDGTGDNTWPTWDPSGTVIGFSATRAGDLCSEIYTVDASGGTIRQLTHEPSVRCGTALGDFEPDWDPVAAHQRLLYTAVSLLDGGDTRRQIIVLQVQTGGARLLSSIAESRGASGWPAGAPGGQHTDAPPAAPPPRSADRRKTRP